MDRATFEKIVGGGLSSSIIDGQNVFVYPDGVLAIGNLRDSHAQIQIESLTPFRLRCLLHGLGIACDWDQPVTFERLMELERAVEDGASVVEIGGWNFVKYEDKTTWMCGDWDITTMREVHLLLEAARNEKT
jgi:hypothetical protein